MRYDVIIVGSGPSGTSTALNLARICPGIAERTLVLERDSHPRHKLCGGGCVPQVDMCLERLGLDYLEVPHVDVDWAHVQFRGRGFPLRFGKGYSFRVVRRNEFDAWLADHVRRRGIEIKEETRVTKLHRSDDGVEIETNRGTFSARVVVGADGTSGVVRKLVPEGAKTCTVARLVELITPAVPASAPATMAADDALLDFAFMPAGVQGYAWSFPTKIAGERMRNWGVYDSRLVPRKSAGSLRPVVAEWMQQAGYRLDDYHLEGHPIRLFEAGASFAAPHVVLVGDAAGVDATFGEGISPALAYGEIAARAIDDAFRRGDFSFAGYRSAVLKSPVGVALRRRTASARALNRFYYPWVQKLLWWRMGPLARWYIKKVLFNWGEPDEPLPAERPSVPVPAPHAPTAPVASSKTTSR
ncbi:MAG: NAD(P)/FAD-dependent oxidoreductase [Planctomycetota bacterium]|nr:MAG: NAD(P)/FAD-dependent oxidoreductase [Planctomycetota bacterium]